MVRNLKIRLMQIGKTQRWMLGELRKAGYKNLCAPRLSAIINGHDQYPSSVPILDKIEEIIKPYEDQQKPA